MVLTQSPQELAEWVALSSVPRVGAVMMRRLLDHFGSAGEALRASPEDLLQISGIGKSVAEQIIQADPVRTAQSLARWTTEGIEILTWADASYPAMLRHVDDAPPTLFMRGKWNLATKRTIAIVGTREATPGAGGCAQYIAKRFAEFNWTVVSGLALGIDSRAHQGALSIDKGRTVAVLGSGINQIYPPKSKQLASQIVQRGAIFSEVLPEADASGPQLVARNRLITGLSQAVIVVEAGANSGAMHAARFAKTQKRVVCAVDFVAEGNYMLIRDGATMVQQNFANLNTLIQALEQRI